MIRSLPVAMAAALLVSACGHKDDVAGVPPPVTSPALAAPTSAVPALAPAVTDAIASTPALSSLAKALAAAGSGSPIPADGPYTVFAPTDDAFARLAPGTLDNLIKPENRTPLAKLLGYHVVAGTIDSADLSRRIAAGGGTATLTTVEGDPLVASLAGTVIALTDVNGNRSYIETADRRSANGVIHVVNGVLVPHLG